MIRQVIDIYAKLLKAAVLIALGTGLTIGRIEKERVLAKKALAQGLVKIPEIRKWSKGRVRAHSYKCAQDSTRAGVRSCSLGKIRNRVTEMAAKRTFAN
jgi:hypothetical protein